MTKKSKNPKNFWVKCYNCDKKIKYKDLQYALWIPEQWQYAAICEECYINRKGNAKAVKLIRKSELNGKRLEYGNILELP